MSYAARVRRYDLKSPRLEEIGIPSDARILQSVRWGAQTRHAVYGDPRQGRIFVLFETNDGVFEVRRDFPDWWGEPQPADYAELASIPMDAPEWHYVDRKRILLKVLENEG